MWPSHTASKFRRIAPDSGEREAGLCDFNLCDREHSWSIRVTSIVTRVVAYPSLTCSGEPGEDASLRWWCHWVWGAGWKFGSFVLNERADFRATAKRKN